jgi:cytochrome c-type biogenesis protein CcmH
MVRRIAAGVVTVALAGIVVAGIAMGEASADDRVRSIGSRLRCPVCQGESIIDSSTEISTAMLAKVDELVAEGRETGAIFQYFTDRYGDGILLDPRFSGSTIVLWLLPLVAAAAGIVLILGRLRRRPGNEEASS